MLSFLIGSIEEKMEGAVVINVGGVGFELAVSSNTLQSLPMPGETTKVYTYMSVREDDISLFGFSSIDERNIFNQLITVSGIGPKMALSILSGLSLSDLVIAITKEDVKILSKIKGLGKKTAERLCLELKDKLSLFGYADSVQQTFDTDYDEDAVQMATDTLISLGINKNEAYILARANAANNATAEEIISKSLRGYKG